MHAVGQRVYQDVTSVLRNRIGRRAVIAVFGVMEARAAVLVTAAILPHRCQRFPPA
jgi:hypothetical protein